MSDNSAIEWTDATWNPVTGCTKVSPGCDHCYAETFAERWHGTEGHYFENGFDVQLRPDKLTLPLSWRKARKVFVNSMSDLFHEAVPDDYVARVFGVMAACPEHTFQVLTKRHGRMRSLLSDDGFVAEVRRARYTFPHTVVTTGPAWPLPNVWLGVSVEDQKRANLRVPALLETPATIRFISAEPLLGPVDLTRLLPRDNGPFIDALSGDVLSRRGEIYAAAPGCVDWVIVGGESGADHRPVDGEWVRSLRGQVAAAGRAFLFKQWGGRTPKSGGRELDGRTWDEYPSRVGVGGV